MPSFVKALALQQPLKATDHPPAHSEIVAEPGRVGFGLGFGFRFRGLGEEHPTIHGEPNGRENGNWDDMGYRYI